MKSQTILRFFLVTLSFLCLTACSTVSDTPLQMTATAPQAQKSILRVQSSWRHYTFEEALETAPTIILGTITAKSDTQIDESVASNGVLRQIYYRNVTVTVNEIYKGDPGLSTVVYKESGGETDTLVCVYDDVQIVDIGDQILLFLNPYGYPLTPTGLYIADEDGSVSISSDMLPVTPGQTRSSSPSYSTMPIEDYCDIIRDYLAQ